MKEKGSWKVKSTKSVYKNQWLSLDEDQVIQPIGEEGIFGTIKMKSGVSILPIDENNNAYIVKEYKYAVEREELEAVGGGIDKGETSIEAAKRELFEETGIKAKSWEIIGKVDPFTSMLNSPVDLYIARELSFNTPSPDATEEISCIKLPFEELVELTLNGGITHAQSVVLVLKAHILKTKGQL